MPSANRKRKELIDISKKKKKLSKKAVTNDIQSEEVSFLFIFYSKNFGKIKLVS